MINLNSRGVKWILFRKANGHPWPPAGSDYCVDAAFFAYDIERLEIGYEVVDVLLVLKAGIDHLSAGDLAARVFGCVTGRLPHPRSGRSSCWRGSSCSLPLSRLHGRKARSGQGRPDGSTALSEHLLSGGGIRGRLSGMAGKQAKGIWHKRTSAQAHKRTSAQAYLSVSASWCQLRGQPGRVTQPMIGCTECWKTGGSREVRTTWQDQRRREGY
jgi:hypothetical protein